MAEQVNKSINPHQKKPVHIKILITIMLSISISIIILSLVIYAYFEGVIVNKIFESERNNLHQAGVSIKLMQDLSKSLAIQMYNDYTLSGLLFVPQEDSLELYHALSSFKKYHNLISYIHSIYIYNPKIETFYITSPASTNMIQRADTFFDGEILGLMEKPEYINSLIPLPRIIKEPDAVGHYREKGVYSFIFELSGKKDIKNSGIIIINIAEDWLRRIIDSLDVNPENKALLIDKQDRLLISYSEKKILAKAAIYDYVKDLINKNQKSGFCIINFDKEDYFLVFSQIEAYDWILIKQIPYRNLMKYISGLRKNLIIISVCLLAVGIVFSFLLSKRLFKPFDKLLEKLKSLEDKSKNDSSILKRYSLNHLLNQSKILNQYELGKIIEELSIDYQEGDSVALVLIEIDQYQKFIDQHSRYEQNLFKLGILDIAQNILNKKYSNAGIDLGSSHEIILINIKNQTIDSYKESIKFLANETQSQIQKTLSISCSVIMSLTTGRLQYVSNLFKRLIRIAKHKFFLGYKAVFAVDEINREPIETFVYPIEKVERVIEAINAGNRKGLIAAYNDVISFVSVFGYDKMKMTIDDLTHRLAKVVYSLKKYRLFNNSFNLEDFFIKIKNSEILSETNQYFYDFFNELLTSIIRRNRKRKYALLAKIIEEIKKEYTDTNLCVSLFADKYKLSAAYLGRLFHDFTGKSMPDYINGFRIRKAAELLEQNEYPILEIMRMTGFSNKTHFYSMFKKYNMLTPSEYRQMASVQAKNI
jgi:two-component system response regulator YesN